MGEHLSPESLKWLRSLRNRLKDIGMGIPEKHIPKRVIDELNMAGKIYRDALGNIVYLVQLDEKLSQMLSKWDKWRMKRNDGNTSGILELEKSVLSQKR